VAEVAEMNRFFAMRHSFHIFSSGAVDFLEEKISL
jgi:hypothetical protein